MTCENTFWVNDIKQLICDVSLIPGTDDSLELSMNKITRLTIILSIVIMFFSIKSGVVVLVITFVFIMSFYFGTKNTPTDEGYSDVGTSMTIIPSPRSNFNEQTAGRFCNDCDASAPNDPDFVYKNQLLVGFGNPKTRVQPIVAPPSHDLDSWAENGLVKRSQINEKKNFDLYRSGYMSSESYSEPMYSTMNKISKGRSWAPSVPTSLVVEGIREERQAHLHHRRMLHHDDDEQFIQECMIDPRVSSYKDRLLTQTLQPGVYQKSNIGEPTNSMIGITFQQQFLPTSVDQNYEEIKFTQQNPEDVRDVPLFPPKCEEDMYVQNYSNIYDPRFTGYGDPHRTYEEPVTGQTRFFYKDIDAIKMPNYVVRSKVDTLPWAPTYGPDKPFQGDYLEHRKLANNAFHDSTLVFRTEMQERLLRKRNAEMWQRRIAPISTNQQIGLGANKSCL